MRSARARVDQLTFSQSTVCQCRVSCRAGPHVSLRARARAPPCARPRVSLLASCAPFRKLPVPCNKACTRYPVPNTIVPQAKIHHNHVEHRRAFTVTSYKLTLVSLCHNVRVVQLHAQHNPNPIACLILYAVLERIVKDMELPG